MPNLQVGRLAGVAAARRSTPYAQTPVEDEAGLPTGTIASVLPTPTLEPPKPQRHGFPSAGEPVNDLCVLALRRYGLSTGA